MRIAEIRMVMGNLSGGMNVVAYGHMILYHIFGDRAHHYRKYMEKAHTSLIANKRT